jgi:hypothetical protein
MREKTRGRGYGERDGLRKKKQDGLEENGREAAN